MADDFGIDPRRAALRNIEFGLNVLLPCPVRDFLRGLVCMGKDPFSPINKARPDLGKVVERQQYTVKFYDKGEQARTGQTNLLRLEIHVSKMAFLNANKKDGQKIETLADLADPEKVEPLGRLLQKALGDVIFYGGEIDENRLSQKELLRLKDFQNPRHWSDLNFRRRFNQKARFDSMIEDHLANKALRFLVAAVPTIWQNLMVADDQKTDVLTASNQNRVAEKNGCFNRLDERLKHPFSDEKEQQQFLPVPKIVIVQNGLLPALGGPAPTAKKADALGLRSCECCGRDISSQKETSRFCSEKRFGKTARRCRDASTVRRRRASRQLDASLFESNLARWAERTASVSIIKIDRDDPERLAVLPAETVERSALFGQKFRGIRAVARLELVADDGERLVFEGIEARRAVRFFAKKPTTARVEPVKIIRARVAAPTAEQPKSPRPSAAAPVPSEKSEIRNRQSEIERRGPVALGDALQQFFFIIKNSQK